MASRVSNKLLGDGLLRVNRIDNLQLQTARIGATVRRQKSLQRHEKTTTLSDHNRRSRFQDALLRWYVENGRNLPWRKNKDPYRVWLSEVMLQQTRVNAVVEYYLRFLEKFPTVQVLAAARVSSVLAAWSGLGYYRRARALHQAAKDIVTKHAGQFPSSAEQLQDLPGVGKYTALAIASIVFDEPVAVVDGNVERVLQRLVARDLRREESWRLAQDLLCRTQPGDFNQAMMELGATICLPRGPKCLVCPVLEFCAVRGALEGKTPDTRKKQEIYYLLDVREGKVHLRRRAKSESLMPGMWELPEHEPNGHIPEFSLRHSITVTDYVVHVSRGCVPEHTRGKWFTGSSAAELPLTGLTRKILRRARII